MQFRTLAFLLIRVLAIYVIIQGVSFVFNLLPSVISYRLELFSGLPGINLLLFNGLVGIIYLLSGILLWYKAEYAANFILKNHADHHEAPHPADSQFYHIGISLTGLIILVQSIPALIGQILTLISFPVADKYEFVNTISSSLWIQLFISLVKIVIALILIMRTNGIYQLLIKARNLGLNQKN